MVYVVKQLVLSFVSIRFKLKQVDVFDSSLQEYNKLRYVAVFDLFFSFENWTYSTRWFSLALLPNSYHFNSESV